MLKILADDNIPLLDRLFGRLGEVTVMPGRKIRSQHLMDVDILLVRSVTRVDSNLLRGSPVKFVGSCTIGTDHLDISYLDKMGIAWANAPGCNANAVVQYVFSVMAMLVPQWPQKIIGIIGCGNVGSRLLTCLRALGVKYLCYDPLIKQDKPELTTFDEVLTADIISCHTPLTAAPPFPTYHLIGENELAQLKPGALLINTSRGAVVDNTALLRLLKKQHDLFKKTSSYSLQSSQFNQFPHPLKSQLLTDKSLISQSLKIALDVWENEPAINSELLALVDIGTPHIAGHSLQGKQQGSVQVYRELCRSLGAGCCDLAELLLADSLIEDKKKIIDLDKLYLDKLCREGDIQAQRNAVLLAAYAINEDDRQLRRWYSQQQPMPVFFDQLRNNYPVRHDYSHCVIPDWLASADSLHKDFLRAMGFASG